jgi:hypothetical protein
MKRLHIVVCIALGTFSGSLGAAPSANQILQELDQLQDLQVDLTSRVKLTQQKVKTGRKILECIFYRRDTDDAFLIVMTGPNAEKGNGYLKTGDNFWMYRSATRIFQHVNRNESIAGTDAKSGDFEKRKLTELYKPVPNNKGQLVIEETLGSVPVYRIEVLAIVNDVTYPKEVYWVRRDNYLPLKVQSYSLSGTLMQTAYYTQYTAIGGKYFPVKGIFIDEFEKGNRTLLDISGISLAPIPRHVFSKAWLENLSR